MTPEIQWGLLACGRSGQTQIDVDQSCGSEELLALEISNPNWSVRFHIPATDTVRELARFLRPKGEETLIVGAFDGTPVEIRRDHTDAERFLVVIGQGCARVEFIITGQQQVSDLSKALSQAAEDLK
jgi:hypothetical protein